MENSLRENPTIFVLPSLPLLYKSYIAGKSFFWAKSPVMPNNTIVVGGLPEALVMGKVYRNLLVLGICYDSLYSLSMKLKSHKQIILLVLATILTVLFYIWFTNSEYFAGFKNWSQNHFVLYVFILLLLKIVGIVWPPIPGGVLTLASVPIVGWQVAYITDFVGSVIGSTIAFFIAKRWGFVFMEKIFDTDALENIKKIKIKKDKEIESIFLMRVFGGTVIEIICYGAGILGVGYRNYLVATVLSHPPIGIPIFYLASSLLGEVLNQNGAIVSIVFLLFAVFLFYRLKHRYFEFE